MGDRSIAEIVRAHPALARVHIASDRELLRALVRSVGRDGERRPRWSHVGAVLGHGAGVSQAICRALDLDPHEVLGTDPEADVVDVLVPMGDGVEAVECPACGAAAGQQCSDREGTEYACWVHASRVEVARG